MADETGKDLTGIGELQALLGKGTEFQGKLFFRGRVRIDGRLQGHVKSDDVLILGPTADVEADVEVGTLIVRGGTLRGEVLARRLVEIYAPSRVHGNIRTAQLFLDKGATFDGQCTMLEDEGAEGAEGSPGEGGAAGGPDAPVR
ncbi:MAG: polymer-forming cytoskeletal protein [Myxococcales bacterium]|jgi:cytoskeletal protein CcmA (bactofilin family)